MNNFLAKLEKKYGRYAIKNLIIYVLAAYGIGYVLLLTAPAAYSYLELNPALVMKGQVWRLITWVCTVPESFSFFILFMFMFQYFIGSSLEKYWGSFRYNCYVFSGIFFMTISTMIVYWITGISMSPSTYSEVTEISDGIKVRFIDAGHLLGSSSIEIWLTENGEERKIVFSGDIGNLDQSLIRDPQYITEADYVVMESTYGNRRHDKPKDYAKSLAEVIQKTFDRGGNLVIPSFAVGRTQELLYFIRHIKAENMVTGHGDFPVYVDSPLAIEATQIFNKNKNSCFDEEAMSYVNKGINPITFSGLNIAVTSDESRAINFIDTPKIIISASGMCEAGRIKHHLKHNLWKPENTILFVGYQAMNTLGRSLVEGAKTAKLFGEEVVVRAEILVLPGVSGHADVDGLDRWIKSYEKPPKKVFVNHGEDSVAEAYKEHLRNDFGLNAFAPYSGAELDLISGEFKNTTPIKIVKKTGASPNYQRLLSALDRLTALVNKSSGLTNKDLAKLTDTINNICAKWND